MHSDSTINLLLEVGTEELPTSAFPVIREHFCNLITEELSKKHLKAESIKFFLTPRRIAIQLINLPVAQASFSKKILGPTEEVGLKNGKPSKALQGFIKSVGVSNSNQLELIISGKVKKFAYTQHIQGRKTLDLIQDIFTVAFKLLPLPRVMRWGNENHQFIRPVKWLVCLADKEIVPISLYGLQAGNKSYGHRFMSAKPFVIKSALSYQEQLKDKYVIASLDEREAIITEQIIQLSKKLELMPLINTSILSEVNALVEYPVAIGCEFNPDFLQIPTECLVSAMENHQKYFPLYTPKKNKEKARLSNKFIAILNLKSKDQSKVVSGNQRVIRSRLEDSKFFWEQDKKIPLNTINLSKLIFQKDLGNIAQKQERIAKIALHLNDTLQLSRDNEIKVTSSLLKRDLLTNIVAEFPELQGITGRHLVQLQTGQEVVANAIEEHYKPKFKNGSLPSSNLGKLMAIADKLDTICGIFLIGIKPTGDKDPYSLRRATTGIIRIILENKIQLNLKDLVNKQVTIYISQNANLKQIMLTKHNSINNLIEKIITFFFARYKSMTIEAGYLIGMINAVSNSFSGVSGNYNICDIQARLNALSNFADNHKFKNLIALNKRVVNILNKNKFEYNAAPLLSLSNLKTQLQEIAELELLEKIKTLPNLQLKHGYKTQEMYNNYLPSLVNIQQPLASFFDNVHVMTNNKKLMLARLQLLAILANKINLVANLEHI